MVDYEPWAQAYQDAAAALAAKADVGHTHAGDGSFAIQSATLSVSRGGQYAEDLVLDANITASSKVLTSWGVTTDADENTPDMDAITFRAKPSNGSMLVGVCAGPGSVVGGLYKLNYVLS